MKRTIILAAAMLALAAASGCASLEYAGNTSVDVKKSQDGKGWELSVKDGKELQGRTVKFNAENGHFVLEEGESKAFKGQAIGAKGLSLFPTTGLGDILGGGSK